MRHVYTGRVVCLISALLAGAAVHWAWRQSRPTVALHRAASPAVTSAGTNASARGGEVYARACISCHAADDAPHGMPARLRAQTSALLDTPAGRAYLVNLMLYGASGDRVNSSGARARRFRHPSFAEFSDRELADVLNLLPAQSPDPPYTTDDVARLRALPLTAEQVAAQRPDLTP